MQLYDLGIVEAASLRHGRTDEHSIVPGEGGERLGEFLQPAVVGKLAIPYGWIGAENQFYR